MKSSRHRSSHSSSRSVQMSARYRISPGPEAPFQKRSASPDFTNALLFLASRERLMQYFTSHKFNKHPSLGSDDSATGGRFENSATPSPLFNRNPAGCNQATLVAPTALSRAETPIIGSPLLGGQPSLRPLSVRRRVKDTKSRDCHVLWSTASVSRAPDPKVLARTPRRSPPGP